MGGNGWVATHEDITERHRTEKALAEAKAAAEQAEAASRAAHTHLTDALDVVPEGLAVFDKNGRLVLWNQLLDTSDSQPPTPNHRSQRARRHH